MNVIFSMPAVNIRAEVTAQVDYVILYSGKSGQLEHIKLTEKRCPRRLIMFAALECHWDTHVKIIMASVSWAFIELTPEGIPMTNILNVANVHQRR